MPTGPSGEKRPAEVIANAVLVGRIGTAKALTPERRKEIAQKGAKARWG